MFRISFISALSDILFSFVEGLIALRILLKFFGANPFTPFVVWVYQTSKPLLAPFEGIFPTATTRNGFVLEVSALFALLVYAFLGYIIREGLEELSTTRVVKHKDK
ncbi:MAG: YggT family protein [Patescibacteria group bacterium]|nr:YggT family protein [Patescibacteria group bacterium]MDE2588965.1 YggT family protein [Patescibacteria group bacterium]